MWGVQGRRNPVWGEAQTGPKPSPQAASQVCGAPYLPPEQKLAYLPRPRAAPGRRDSPSEWLQSS